MAGGSGDRFWPLSIPQRPKQLLELISEQNTMLQETLNRIQPLIFPENQIISTVPSLQELVLKKTPSLTKDNIICEPYKKNTAGCLIWISAQLASRHPENWEKISLAILPADHSISSLDSFQNNLATALDYCETHSTIVTIGIPPTRPETGYGYIEIVPDDKIPYTVKRFREKPNVEQAKEFLNTQLFYWNSGMFFWTLETFSNQLKIAHPELHQKFIQIAEALQNNKHQLAEEIFSTLPNISIDYALMENATNVHMIPAQFEWDDVGSWDALARLLPNDSNQNATYGETYCWDTVNSLLYNKNSNLKICTLGIKDLIVVATEDSIMICPKERAQEVRTISESFKNDKYSS